jgi:pimeloyl-ACP methyl ester carboxylesterase
MDINYVYVNGKKIAYSIMGVDSEYPPLLLLNGIMMSIKSWEKLIPDLSFNRKLILMDFLDQGSSDRMEEDYDHSLQIQMVIGLLEKLGINKINLAGISYGAQIALGIASLKPQLVNKLLVFNGALYTNPWLKDIGDAWELAAKKYDPELFYNVAIPYIYSKDFYIKNFKWMEERKALLVGIFTNQFLNSMIRLIRSSHSYDLREEAKKIKAHTLVVGSDNDYITPFDETKKIFDLIENSYLLEIKDCGHASMYEKPIIFLMAINGFLNTNTNITIVN